jgi:hypothetical protein
LRELRNSYVKKDVQEAGLHHPDLYLLKECVAQTHTPVLQFALLLAIGDFWKLKKGHVVMFAISIWNSVFFSSPEFLKIPT